MAMQVALPLRGGAAVVRGVAGREDVRPATHGFEGGASAAVSITGDAGFSYDATTKTWRTGTLKISEGEDYHGVYTLTLPDGFYANTVGTADAASQADVKTVAGGQEFYLVTATHPTQSIMLEPTTPDQPTNPDQPDNPDNPHQPGQSERARQPGRVDRDAVRLGDGRLAGRDRHRAGFHVQCEPQRFASCHPRGERPRRALFFQFRHSCGKTRTRGFRVWASRGILRPAPRGKG
jgi:hypothetical protein